MCKYSLCTFYPFQSKCFVILFIRDTVADIRESPVEKIVHELKEYDVDVYGYDPLLSDSVITHFGAKPLPKLDTKMDAVIIAVAHSVILRKCRFMRSAP